MRKASTAKLYLLTFFSGRDPRFACLSCFPDQARRQIVGDQTLSAAREHLRAREAYEKLCLLYVAKHALYCLRASAKDNTNHGRLLHDHFPGPEGDILGNRTLGDPKWFEAYQPQKLDAIEIKGGKIQKAKRQTQESSPSSHEGEDIPASLILADAKTKTP
jgi:hypothetical protein